MLVNVFPSKIEVQGLSTVGRTTDLTEDGGEHEDNLRTANVTQ